MKTHYSLYENRRVSSLSENKEYVTLRLYLAKACDGFKVFNVLIPDFTTKTVWITIGEGSVTPLELQSPYVKKRYK